MSCKLSKDNNQVILINAKDERIFVPLSESLQNIIYLNADKSTTDEHDLTEVTDPLRDDTIVYSKIENNPSMIVTLRKTGNPGEETSSNAVFAFTNDKTISEIDTNAVSSDVSDVYLVNKDIYIYSGQNSSHQNVYMSLKSAANSSGGVETRETYQGLADEFKTAPNQTAFEEIKPIFLVLENNTLYAKKGERKLDGSYNIYWYPVEDPYVQPYTKQGVHTLDSNLTEVSFSTFQSWFSTGENTLNLKSDGSNFYIFDEDGKFIPFYLYSNNNVWTLKLGIKNSTSITINSGKKIIVSTLKGGEQYAASYTVLQAGTQEASEEVYYTGSLKSFRIKTSLVALPNKVNVFVNGEIKNETLSINEGTVSSKSSNTLTLSSNPGLSSGNYYFYDIIKQELYEITSSSGNTINVSNTANITVGDAYIILDKNIYDYFVDSTNNSIVFFDDLNAGDIVRVEDRVSVVSNFEAASIGSLFPADPIFGMEFYLNRTLYETTDHTDYNLDGDANDTLQPGWYKYNGSEWVQLS